MARHRSLSSFYPRSLLADDPKTDLGVHPWFSHQISLLDRVPTKLDHYTALFPTTSVAEIEALLPALGEVVSIESVLEDLQRRWSQDNESGLGEIGLDRAFQLLNVPYTFESKSRLGQEGRKYSNLTTPIGHQVAIVQAQIRLLRSLPSDQRQEGRSRAISFHSVRAPAATFECFKTLRQEMGQEEWKSLRICVHSFGGSVDSIRELSKRKVPSTSKAALSLSALLTHTSRMTMSQYIHFSFSPSRPSSPPAHLNLPLSLPRLNPIDFYLKPIIHI